MSDDLESSCSFETVKPGLPFFTPPPLDDVLRGIDSLNVPADAQVPPTVDGSFPTYRDPSTLSLSSSSGPTDLTGLTEDISNSASSSAYSFMTSDYPQEYPSLFELALCDIIHDSENNHVDPQHNSVFSDLSTFHHSFGTQLSLQHDHVVEPVEAQADDGPPVGISPHRLSQGLSSALQSPPPAVPIDPPADTPSNTKVFTGPIRTKSACNQCDQCGRVFDRKSNLKSHMKTHDPNRERPFVCPESDCGYRFTRSNDLKRHVENLNIHGVREE